MGRSLQDYEAFQCLTNSSRYNKMIRPFVNDGPVVINASMHLYSMASLDDLRTEYKVHMMYRQSWYDHRLRWSNDCKQRPASDPIVGGQWKASAIWTPVLDVINSKDIATLVPRDDTTGLLHLYSNGRVVYTLRAQITAGCRMQFYRYPVDRQTCTLEIESVATSCEPGVLTDKDLRLRWEETRAMELNPRFAITGFELTNYSVEERVTSYWEGGNFSKLVAKFHIKREIWHFLLDQYIPGIMLVVTSWTGFWVEIPAAPARVSLSLTSLLTLITIEKTVREKLPRVNYINALDIWNVTNIASVETMTKRCAGFIFATLLEYAAVNYVYHREKRRRQGGLRRIESSATVASMVTDSGSILNLTSKVQHNPASAFGMEVWCHQVSKFLGKKMV
ncbi:GLRA3, partial [Cordylochernes scorpioides]